MYSAIAANKRNTVFIIAIFLVVIGGLGVLVAWLYNSWTIAVVVFAIALAYAIFQYFVAGSETLALSGARQIQKSDNPRLYRIVENLAITDGLPTAHFEQQMLYLLYPPDPRTEAATMREGLACQREGITINMFLLPSWSQTEEDVRFAFRLAESTKGRVFFTAGRGLDRYVVWDYLSRRRELVN